METSIIILIILILLAKIVFLFIRHNLPKIKGKNGERIVGRHLSSLPAENYIVLNNLMFSFNGRTTQIDHIVVSVHGIFVIETKNYKGWIYGNTEKDYWTQNIWGNKYSLYNPVIQNKNHIKFLYNKFDVLRKNIKFLHPIVTFLSAERLEITGEDECVLWHNEAVEYILSFKEPVLSMEECKNIASLLVEENISEREEREAHNINVIKAKVYHDNLLRNEICPCCGGKLVLRKGKYGNFHGCSNYPYCRYTN